MRNSANNVIHLNDQRYVRSLVQGVSDVELVEQILEGNQGAKSVLVRRHVTSVAGVVARLLGSTDGADDIVHDAFLDAFRDLKKLEDGEAFRSWLTRIAVHRTHNVLRRRKLETRLGLRRNLTDATLEHLADESLSPEDRVRLAEIDEVLCRLSTKLRMAWILKHVEGYSLKEVAALCGCSLTTAKRRIRSAHSTILKHVRLEGAQQ